MDEEQASTPEERAELLQMCEKLVTFRPGDPRAKELVARVLKMAGLALADRVGGDEGLPTPLAAIDLYEAMLRSAPFCFRDGCEHHFDEHEGPELALLPDGAYDAMTQEAYNALDFHCRVAGCACPRFLEYHEAVKLYLGDSG